jgi:PAS domain S-box-containing protein
VNSSTEKQPSADKAGWARALAASAGALGLAALAGWGVGLAPPLFDAGAGAEDDWAGPALALALAALRREAARREQSEARLRAMLDTSAIGIIVIDQQARIQEFNQACEALFGYSQEEAVGRNVGMLMPEPYRSAHDGYINSYLATGVPKVIGVGREVAGLRKDGSVFPLELLVGEIGIGSGRAFIGFLKDVSGRKRLESAAKHCEAIVLSSEDAIASKTLEGIVTSWNPGAQAVFGYAADEMLGQPMLVLFPPGREDEEKLILEQIQRGERVSHFETVRVAKDGTPIDVSVTISPIRDGAGKVVGASSIARDITAHKQAEARLQLAANVFTHAREGIMITDAEGSIIEVNGAFSRITGYSRGEAIGRNPRILKSGQQPPAFYASMWEDLARLGHWDGEIWNRHKNGEVYAEILTISAVRDAAGQTRNYVALFTDITPIKAHQQQLEHIAHYDALTNLPNRVLLADRLRQAMAHSQRQGRSLAVVYLDLDGFKAVNDSYGHDVGDELLSPSRSA